MARGQYFLDLINKRHWTFGAHVYVAEIGVKAGATSKILLKHSGVHLLMVDPWRSVPGYERWSEEVCEEYFAQAKQIVRKHNDRDITMFRGTSTAAHQFAKAQQQRYDMVILDADHSYEHVLEDITSWIELLKQGGVMCGRFYGEIPGVTKAVDEYVNRFGLRLVLPSMGHAWHFIKVNSDG